MKVIVRVSSTWDPLGKAPNSEWDPTMPPPHHTCINFHIFFEVAFQSAFLNSGISWRLTSQRCVSIKHLHQWGPAASSPEPQVSHLPKQITIFPKCTRGHHANSGQLLLPFPLAVSSSGPGSNLLQKNLPWPHLSPISCSFGFPWHLCYIPLIHSLIDLISQRLTHHDLFKTLNE